MEVLEVIVIQLKELHLQLIVVGQTLLNLRIVYQSKVEILQSLENNKKCNSLLGDSRNSTTATANVQWTFWG